MSNSSVIEDPGIPLVDRNNTKYSKYVEEDASDKGSRKNSLAVPSRFDNISYRLSRRKNLCQRRRIIVDVEFILAMVGIILMMVETELYIARVVTKSSAVSIVLKTVISGSTVFLIASIIAYYITGVQITMAENGLDDWRLAISFPWTYLKCACELVICAVHPFPGDIRISSYDIDGKVTLVSIDALLSIFMLFRFYLIGKFMVVHSRLLMDTSTQSIGALNKVKIDTAFIFKALMSTIPGTMLIALLTAMFFVDSWAMRTCEVYYHYDEEHSSFLNSMWLIAITILTVGYGDITPNSYCGRFISVITGLMGVGTTALLVAVLAQKLEQSRSEKYVYNFVSRVQLDKAQKNAASDVIKHVMKLWRMKRNGKIDERKHIRTYGKLTQAIHTMREAKNEKMSIGESTIGFIEINKSIGDVLDIVEEMQVEQTEFRNKVKHMEERFDSLESKLNAIFDAVVKK